MDSFAKAGLSGRRDNLLKAVTIGVLLLSTGVAWLIVRGTSGRVDSTEATLIESGTRALAQIRNQGLDKYWGSDTAPQEQWYLIYENGRMKGWRAVRRWRQADGTHKGLHLNFPRVSFPRGLWEYWQFNGDGTEGFYQAGEVLTVNGAPRLNKKTTTTIALRNGRVALRQHEPENLVSQADVPDNYVPEGMLDLACFVAVLRGSDAQFRLIFNDDPPDGNTTQFGSVTVSDIKQIKGGLQAMLTIAFAQGGTGRRILLFDRTGQLRAKVGGPSEERLVARETVLRKLPNAARYMADIYEQVVTSGREGTPPPATAPAPGDRPPT